MKLEQSLEFMSYVNNEEDVLTVDYDEFYYQIHNLIDSSKFHSPTAYVEVRATGSTPDGDAKAQYWTGSAWADVAGAAVSWTISGRQRGSGFSLISGAYEYRIVAKSSSADSRIKVARIIIKDTATTITKSQGQNEICYVVSTTLTTYQKKGAIFLWESAKYDGTLSVFFEAYMYQNKTAGSAASKTAYACLWDKTADSQVSGSEVTTTSNSLVRLRSGAITLTDGHEYVVAIKHTTSGSQVFLNSGKIIVEQTGMTKTRLLKHIAFHSWRKGVDGSLDLESDHYYDPSEFDGYDKATVYEASMYEQPGGGPPTPVLPYTSQSDLWRDANFIVVLETTSTVVVRVRSSALTLLVGNHYTIIGNTVSTNYIIMTGSWLLIDLTPPAAPPTVIPRRKLIGVGR